VRSFRRPDGEPEGNNRDRSGGRSFRSGDDRPFRPRQDRPVRTRDEEGRSREAFEPRFEDRRERRPPPHRKEAPAAARAPETSSYEGERVAKIIARVGLGSRRDAESWIEAGRVAVNGEVLTSAARNVTPGDRITVDGQPLPARERTRLWLYHKPRGLVTTEKDPEGRPTVFERLPASLPRVLSIGRLDINTEGLLLLTNDGGLARVLELPKTGWLRRYRVRAHGETDQAKLDTLAEGLTIDGVDYGPIEARHDREQGTNAWLTIGLREGKNREVKNVLAAVGLEVNRLIRVSYGPFQLGDLAEGAVEEISTRVLMDQLGKDLAEEAGCEFDAPVFERPVDPVPKPQEGSKKRRGLRVTGEDGETERVIRGALIEDRRGRRVLVQRVSDAPQEGDPGGTRSRAKRRPDRGGKVPRGRPPRS
jgi:23S rRNA pseudouridine2605 synthase